MIPNESNFDILMLSLKATHKYECRVEHYTIGHSQMRIRVNKPMGMIKDKNAFNLILTNVIYFEGSLQWLGANFSFGSVTELTPILQQASIVISHYIQPFKHNEMSDQNMKEYRLFKFGKEQKPVKIVAKYITKVDTKK